MGQMSGQFVKPKKIAVLFGGNSDEKEVSLHTGLSVIEAIKEDYDITSINMQDDYSDLYQQLIDIDVVFIALHGGYGEHNIQGIGDKHVPLIHNVMNTDFVVDVSDQATNNLNMIFNTEIGKNFLIKLIKKQKKLIH